MIHLLIIKDNEDAGRGEYFEESQMHLSLQLANHSSINHIILSTTDCEQNTIDFHIRAYNSNPFIFVAYTHGGADAIYIGGQAYIDINNAYLFGETLFYACSCLAAKELGPRLREMGCKVFMGYNDTISSLNPDTESFYYTCENEFIKLFLTTESTIGDCLKGMYTKYDEYKDYLKENYSSLEASILEGNQNSFTIICDDADYALTHNYFIPTSTLP